MNDFFLNTNVCKRSAIEIDGRKIFEIFFLNIMFYSEKLQERKQICYGELLWEMLKYFSLGIPGKIPDRTPSFFNGYEVVKHIGNWGYLGIEYNSFLMTIINILPGYHLSANYWTRLMCMFRTIQKCNIIDHRSMRLYLRPASVIPSFFTEYNCYS